MPLTAQEIIPSDIARDSTIVTSNEILDAINNLNESILYMTAAILEKLPRVTGNDQAAVTVEGNVNYVASMGTLTTLNTLDSVNRAGGKYISGDNLNLSGLTHIYNGIVVE